MNGDYKKWSHYERIVLPWAEFLIVPILRVGTFFVPLLRYWTQSVPCGVPT